MFRRLFISSTVIIGSNLYYLSDRGACFKAFHLALLFTTACVLCNGKVVSASNYVHIYNLRNKKSNHGDFNIHWIHSETD